MSSSDDLVSKRLSLPLRSIDLFAGIGGIRLGFEQAFGKNNIDTVFVSEIDKFAQQTYKTNFEDFFELSGDITQIDPKDIPDHDILCAGFPCQAFSVGGKKQGFSDNYKGRARGTLFFNILNIIHEKKPAILFLENVKHLVRHDSGKTFEVIKGSIEDAGYTMFYKVIDSKDFGVPQSRQRTYMVCFRNDIAPQDFNFPLPIDEDKRLKIKDIKEDDADIKYYISKTYYKALERHKNRHKDKGNGFGYVVRDDNSIFGTLTCSGSGKEQNILCEPKEKIDSLDWTDYKKGEPNELGLRVPTPKEFARAQGFPDDYIIPVSDTQAYKQFGNSVSVPVIKAIADKIKEYVLEEA